MWKDNAILQEAIKIVAVAGVWGWSSHASVALASMWLYEHFYYYIRVNLSRKNRTRILMVYTMIVLVALVVTGPVLHSDIFSYIVLASFSNSFIHLLYAFEFLIKIHRVNRRSKSFISCQTEKKACALRVATLSIEEGEWPIEHVRGAQEIRSAIDKWLEQRFPYV